MVQIDRYNFTEESISEVRSLSHWGQDVGNNWPVVYILNNNKEAYVGETLNAATRFEQHMQNPERKRLTEIRIVTDNNFNKSVILDLESFLIKHMAADGKYNLQNGNDGLTNHEYYKRLEYEDSFYDIWDKLYGLGVVSRSILDIENSALYKYSPFKSLGKEQIQAEREILRTFTQLRGTGENATIIINGGAGTGKTILAIYLIKLIVDDKERNLPDSEEEDDEITAFENAVNEAFGDIRKIGIVFPQKSLQLSIKEVFSSIRGLSPDMVLSPTDVVNDYITTGKKYDLLLVDEAHRLKYREQGALTNYPIYKKCNKELGLSEKKGNELDWILKCSENRILFRDELQTIRPCDIRKEVFDKSIYSDGSIVVHKTLKSQWRCEGGDKYIDYLKSIFFDQDTVYQTIDNYDLKLYENCKEMIDDIKAKNKEMDLCRTAAGFAWPWDKKDKSKCTIDIQGHKYKWNTTDKNWIDKANSENEIGCIHTVQGYDLNYAGIIIGGDLKYNSVTKKMFSDKTNYYDVKGKSTIADDPEKLCEYIKNIYLTLLTRGIKGTYIYVCDDALRDREVP